MKAFASTLWDRVGHLLFGEIPADVAAEAGRDCRHGPSDEDERPCCYRSRFNEDGLDYKELCELYSAFH
jgi:hypothetical protein